MWVKVKPEFTGASYVALVLLDRKVDSQVCSIDFHLAFIICFKVHVPDCGSGSISYFGLFS